MHRTSTAHQQPPSTFGPCYHRRACPPDHQCRVQPDSGEHSPSDPQNRTPLDAGLLLVNFPTSLVIVHHWIDGSCHHLTMERLTPLFPFVAESEPRVGQTEFGPKVNRCFYDFFLLSYLIQIKVSSNLSKFGLISNEPRI
jgi:hypothetical protein